MQGLDIFLIIAEVGIAAITSTAPCGRCWRNQQRITSEALFLLCIHLNCDVECYSESASYPFFKCWSWPPRRHPLFPSSHPHRRRCSFRRITSEATVLLCEELNCRAECSHESTSYPFHICWSWLLRTLLPPPRAITSDQREHKAIKESPQRPLFFSV